MGRASESVHVGVRAEGRATLRDRVERADAPALVVSLVHEPKGRLARAGS
jgi:hypothetical protein